MGRRSPALSTSSRGQGIHHPFSPRLRQVSSKLEAVTHSREGRSKPQGYSNPMKLVVTGQKKLLKSSTLTEVLQQRAQGIPLALQSTPHKCTADSDSLASILGAIQRRRSRGNVDTQNEEAVFVVSPDGIIAMHDDSCVTARKVLREFQGHSLFTTPAAHRQQLQADQVLKRGCTYYIFPEGVPTLACSGRDPNRSLFYNEVNVKPSSSKNKLEEAGSNRKAQVQAATPKREMARDPNFSGSYVTATRKGRRLHRHDNSSLNVGLASMLMNPRDCISIGQSPSSSGTSVKRTPSKTELWSVPSPFSFSWSKCCLEDSQIHSQSQTNAESFSHHQKAGSGASTPGLRDLSPPQETEEGMVLRDSGRVSGLDFTWPLSMDGREPLESDAGGDGEESSPFKKGLRERGTRDCSFVSNEACTSAQTGATQDVGMCVPSLRGIVGQCMRPRKGREEESFGSPPIG